MVSRNIRYIALICILFFIYVCTPFELIRGIVASVSFDRKIDPESLPYLRIVYHGIMLSAIATILLITICKKALLKNIKNFYRMMDNTTPYRWLFVISMIAVTIRIALLILVRNEQVSDFQEYHEFAQNIVSGYGYIRNGQPTAWFPVGYPFFLSLLYRAFGTYPIVGQTANILLTLLIIICTYVTAEKLFTAQTAKLSVLLVALWPNFIAYTGLLCSDLFFAASLTGLLTVMIIEFRNNWLQLTLTGLLFATATLTRTGIALFIAVIIWYLFINRRTNFTKFSLRCGVLIISALLLFAPWWIRNYQVFDRFIPLSTNGGFNFWLGNVQIARANDPGAMDAVWPDTEYEMSSYGYRIGYEYIKDNPGAFLIQIPVKIINLFILDISGWRWLQKGLASSGLLFLIAIAISQFYYLLMLVFAAVGIFFTGKHFSMYFRMGHYLMAATICYWIAIHCVFFGKDRYHLPLIPLIAMYTAFGISFILKKLSYTTMITTEE